MTVVHVSPAALLTSRAAVPASRAAVPASRAAVIWCPPGAAVRLQLAYPVSRCATADYLASRYAPCVPGYPNFASCAMYAHRLWTILWTASGKPADKLTRPVGNAAVTTLRPLAVHSAVTVPVRPGHTRCARKPRGLAGRMAVIPGIHCPYDDYHSSYQTYLHTKAGSPAAHGNRPASVPNRRPSGGSASPASTVRLTGQADRADSPIEKERDR
jgi:hypothetical protein